MNRTSRLRHAFSLIEVLMAVALMTAFSAMAVLHFKRSYQRAGSQGLAHVLAEEFRRVRQEAIARRRPTALLLPTNQSRSSATRSFYVMDGEILPRIIRSRSFNSEFNGADIFTGVWPLMSGAFQDPPAGNDLPGSKWPTFRVDNWLQPGSQALDDYCFAFLPDGTLHTHNVKMYDGRYHVVIGAGAISPGGLNARLQACGECYTISLSPVGGVTLSSGLLGQDGSIQTRGKNSTQIAFGAPRALPVSAETPTPLNDNPKIFPEPKAKEDPADADSVITKDQYVTLKMQAKSSSGEQLYCSWKVVDGPPGKEGAFSILSDVAPGSSATEAGGRMEWDQALNGGQGAWTAIWQWRPPIDAVYPEVYRLRCEVQNINSGEKSVAIREFQIRPPSKILYDRVVGGDHEIWTMDESGARNRVYLAQGMHPSATLNGMRIVYVQKDGAQQGNLFLHCPTDPSGDIQLTTGKNLACPAISPSGNFIAYVDLADRRVKVMKTGRNAPGYDVPGADPVSSNESILKLQTYRLGWTRDGQFLLCPGANQIKVVQVTPGGGGAPNCVHNPGWDRGGLIAGSNGPLSGVTCLAQSNAGNPGSADLLYVDNWNNASAASSGIAYDPWVMRDDGSNRNQYKSIGFEDTSVERSPNDPTWVLMVRGAVGSGSGRQIHKVQLTGTGAVIHSPLTPAGAADETRPVWTE